MVYDRVVFLDSFIIHGDISYQTPYVGPHLLEQKGQDVKKLPKFLLMWRLLMSASDSYIHGARLYTQE